MMKEAMVQAEMKGAKDRLHAKRKNGTRKSIGTLPSMKKGKLRAAEEAIVTARLIGGVALAAVSPNTSLSRRLRHPPPLHLLPPRRQHQLHRLLLYRRHLYLHNSPSARAEKVPKL